MLRPLLFALAPLLAACAPEASAPVPAAPSDTTAIEPAAPPAGGGSDAAAADTLDVLFFGNSLTAGYGLEGRHLAFPALVEARAREAGLPVRAVNAGNSGETSAGGLRRIEWVLQDGAPDVFVLELGANDGLRGLDPAAMQQNLSGILDRVRAANPEAVLVIAGMQGLPNYGAAYTDAFRRVFPALAEEHDAVLVPFLLEGVGGIARLNQRDGVHPTAEGQRILAENVWRVLEPVLREQVQA